MTNYNNPLTARLIAAIENTRARSAWSKGVKQYAIELVEWHDESAPDMALTKAVALNGARDWWEYSENGNALLYSQDIAERLCTAAELKLTNNGRRRPNKREDWIDVQGRALFQAWRLVDETMQNL